MWNLLNLFPGYRTLDKQLEKAQTEVEELHVKLRESEDARTFLRSELTRVEGRSCRLGMVLHCYKVGDPAKAKELLTSFGLVGVDAEEAQKYKTPPKATREAYFRMLNYKPQDLQADRPA